MYAKTFENLFMCMLIDQYCILSYAATQYANGNCSLVEVTFEHNLEISQKKKINL